VEGLAVDNDDWWIYPYHIAVRLVTGQCDCGKSHCPSQHNLAAQPSSGLALTTFIYRAVLGPVGLRAKSFPQGMLFPFLRDYHGLRAGLAEFKRCPVCGCLYDGAACLTERCYTPFDPTTTRVVGVDWLFIEGVYRPVRRWRCPQCDNLHPQIHCWEVQSIEINDEGEEEIHYQVVHGQEHDHCPLCPARHPNRGTEVWLRAEYVAAGPMQSEPPPRLLEGIAEGMRKAIAALDGWHAVILAWLAEREPAPADQWAQDELLTLAEALFDPGADRPTLGKLLRRLQGQQVPDAPQTAQAISMFLKRLHDDAPNDIQQALAERGIDEETVNEWLRSTRDLDVEWGEEETDEDDRIA
jgi:hypothetical protein